jgi:glutathione S-transferase
MLRLYDSLRSGNSWKVRILLSQFLLRYERLLWIWLEAIRRKRSAS